MIKGKAEITFGTGDIRTTTLLHDGKIGIYVLNNQEPHEIGESIPVSNDYTIKGKEVMITFSKVESIDVVIEDLQHIKRLMLGEEKGTLEINTSPTDFWVKADKTKDTSNYKNSTEEEQKQYLEEICNKAIFDGDIYLKIQHKTVVEATTNFEKAYAWFYDDECNIEVWHKNENFIIDDEEKLDTYKQFGFSYTLELLTK